MGVQAGQFRQQNTDVLRPLGRFQAQKLLHRQAIGEIIRKWREVIDAVGKCDGLRIGQRFAAFLDAGMEIANLRPGSDYGFAVELQHHAQHAMSRGVLRSHIQDHRLSCAGGGLNRGGHVRKPSTG